MVLFFRFGSGSFVLVRRHFPHQVPVPGTNRAGFILKAFIGRGRPLPLFAGEPAKAAAEQQSKNKTVGEYSQGNL
jgi:hypothetical protein